MNDTIEEILAICLDKIEAGASPESCLADYPNQAAELEPLLRMTQLMKRLTAAGPRPSFARNARLNLENQLAKPGIVVTFKSRFRRIWQEPKFLTQRRFSMSVLQLVIAAVLALTATTGSVAFAANASNPGDALHGLDLAMEKIQLNLAPDVASKVQLRLQFANERLDEAQATFSENDLTDGLEAVHDYGEEISSIAQLIGEEGGSDQEALASLLDAAHAIHTEVLTGLLDTVPDQAKDGIQRAIEASNRSTDTPESASDDEQVPEETNTPDDASAPEDTGSSHGNGAPDSVGKPDGVGNPNGVGAPNGVGNPHNGNVPGAIISGCANSISQEDAQALAALAQNHGLDYQYVLENFCTLGTLEQVEEMLSQFRSPPANVPGGPPDGASGGPPSDHPGGPPFTPPGRQ